MTYLFDKVILLVSIPSERLTSLSKSNKNQRHY